MDLNEAKIIAEMNHDGFPLGKIMAMYPVTHDALNWALGELEASKTATDYAALEAERDEWKRRCEAMWAWLYRNDSAAYTDLSDFMHEKERQEYVENNQMNTDFAEGRDNG